MAGGTALEKVAACDTPHAVAVTRLEAWLLLGARAGYRPQKVNEDKPASHRQLFVLNERDKLEATAEARAELLAAAQAQFANALTVLNGSTVARANKGPAVTGPFEPAG